MSITRNFALFLNAGFHNAPLINVNQYDQGEQWIFTLYRENGSQYIPTTGAIVGIKSDGYIIENAGTVNGDGQVVIDETQQMTAAPGKAIFELQLDSNTHGTANFIVMVEQSPTDEGIVSDSDLDLIRQALNAVNPTVISEAITEWMDENITDPTEPIVDSSLTVSGAAADSKTVGDTVKEGTISGATWTENYYISATGVATSSSGFRYSSLIPVKNGLYELILFRKATSSSARNTRIHGYDSNGTWVKQISVLYTPGATTGKIKTIVDCTDTSIKYIRISIIGLTEMYVCNLVSLVPMQAQYRLGNPIPWEQGLYSIGSGAAESSLARMRTVGFIGDSVDTVYSNEEVLMCVLAWDYNTYIGCWTGAGFSKTVSAALYSNAFDLRKIREAYPTYRYKLNCKNVADTTGITPSYMYQQILFTENSTINYDPSNLLNSAYWTKDYYINASGVITSSSGFEYSTLISVKNGCYRITYYPNATSYSPAKHTRVHGYDSSGTWVKQIQDYAETGSSDRRDVYFITDSSIKQVRISTSQAFTLLYLGEYESVSESDARMYDNIVRTVNRIADALPFPRQSILGYKFAYALGFRNMLCDLRFTSDNVPVCFHDEYLNQTYQDVMDSNHNFISTDPPVYVNQITYAQFNTYDVGYYRGEGFANTRVLSLEQMLNLCRYLGCRVYLEMKVTPTDEQYGIVFDLIHKYGMDKNVVWSPQSIAQVGSISGYNPNVYIQYHTNISGHYTEMPDGVINTILAATNDYNKGHNTIILPSDVSITDEQLATLAEHGIGICTGTAETTAYIDTYISRGAKYKCFVESMSQTFLVGKYMRDSQI